MGAPQLERFSKEVTASELNAAMVRDGCAIVEGIADDTVLASINQDLDACIAQTAPGVRYGEQAFTKSVGKRGDISFEDMDEKVSGATPEQIEALTNDFYGSGTVRIDGLPAKSSSFVDLMCHPLNLSIADHFLLPNCYHYLLNTGQLIEIQPGETSQELHRDEGAWFNYSQPRPELSIQGLLAVSDFSRQNGATQIVPGSHRWDAQRKPVPEEITVAEMPAGSVVYYLGSTLHGGGENLMAQQSRRGMLIAYCLGWLRTEENTFLSTPIEDVRGMPRLAQELLGYEAHVGIGVVNVGSPMRLLHDD